MFLPTVGRRPGRLVTLNPDRCKLATEIRRLPYELAEGKSARKIAKLLGASDDDNYKHQKISDVIKFVMDHFTRPIPGEGANHNAIARSILSSDQIGRIIQR